MKPAVFDYHAPERLDEALTLLADEYRDVRPLAGGQSLVPMMNFRLATPEALVDLRRIEGLEPLRVTPDGDLVMGAGVRQAALLEDAAVVAGWPLLAAAVRHIGHPQIRSRGTVCGSLAHHDPTAELPAVATALDARLTVAGADGTRTVDAAGFFVSYYEVALEPGELLVEVRFPRVAPGTGWSFRELARRRGDFALVGVAVTLLRGPGGATEDPRVVLLGVAERPLRLAAAEELLAGAPVDAEALERVREAVAAGVDPVADVHASADYRREVAASIAVAAIAEAWERCDG